MKSSIKQLIPWFHRICETNHVENTSYNKLILVGLLSVILFNSFIALILGPNKLVLITLIIPFAGFGLAYYLNKKNLIGIGQLIIIIVSIVHVFILVLSYESQYLELLFFFLATAMWLPFNNLYLIKTIFFIIYVCFILTGFQLNEYNILEIGQWPDFMVVYFVLINFSFLTWYHYMSAFKKGDLQNQLTIINKNKEIEAQNELIQLNTKKIIKYEHDKHEMELSTKQKDLELLHINNQMKVKMKNDLINELSELKKSDALLSDVQSVINRLKHQVEEEKKINLIQENIDIVGSGFYDRIKQEFPELSKSDVELLSFIKLKLTNKQIAAHKNTSPNTINVTLHRLRQKCNFETTIDLRNFIETF